MSHPVFTSPTVVLTVREIATLTHADLRPDVAGATVVRGAASLADAGAEAVACAGPGDEAALTATCAGACFVLPGQLGQVPPHTVALVTARPAAAFAAAVAALYPGARRPGSDFAASGISPAAIVHPEARLEAGVMVDPGAVVGPRAEIGAGTLVGANSVVGPGVRIGRDCAIGAQVTIANALIGNRVVIRPGARIGQDHAAAGDTHRPGLGRVIVQDDSDIGANTVVDRGGLGDTVIGEGSRIGSLLHIAGDRMIDRHTVLRVASD